MRSPPVSITSEDHTCVPCEDDKETLRVMMEDDPMNTTGKAMHE